MGTNSDILHPFPYKDAQLQGPIAVMMSHIAMTVIQNKGSTSRLRKPAANGKQELSQSSRTREALAVLLGCCLRPRASCARSAVEPIRPNRDFLQRLHAINATTDL